MSTRSIYEVVEDQDAEVKKQQFLRLVEQLSLLRDLQYEKHDAEETLELARKVVARNLPSNLLRAAAIFVDCLYGFPPGHGSFTWPDWVNARKLLPENQRGSLTCSGFQEVSTLGEGDVVVLTADVPSNGLCAGMAGIIRELPGEDGNEEVCLVEFGEPEQSITVEVQVPRSSLRTPRPGDLLEGFRP